MVPRCAPPHITMLSPLSTSHALLSNRAVAVIRRHATGVIVGRALQQSWHREREADAGKGDTGERARRRVASIGEWDRRMIYR